MSGENSRATIASKLPHRRQQSLDVLRARQAVVAVLDQREHHVVVREARNTRA